MKRIVKWGAYGVGGIFGLIVLAGLGGFLHFQGRFKEAFEPAPPLEGVPSITVYADEQPAPASSAFVPLRPGSVDLQNLAQIDKAARPWARWWWPGGDIDAGQACAELEGMDKRGIGGVEIQPFNFGLEPIESKTTTDRINSFASDQFNRALSEVMACADRLDMDIYINHLSGWPAGGPQVPLEDGMHSLATAHFEVQGGRAVRKALPRPKPGVNAYLLAAAEVFVGAQLADFPADRAEFVSAVAMRKLGGEHTDNPVDATDSIRLDPATAIVLDEFVADGELAWEAPDGKWTVVVTYILPAGEAPTLIAQEHPGYVIDHLREEQVIGHYNWAYGARTGLDAHYGKAFKGFFNDSLEFKVDRLATHDILEEFEKRRGYDLRPYLPVVMVDAVDNYFLRDVGGLYSKPRYQLTDNDERIRRDYQQTLSDLIVERFLETSAEWAEARNLYSRGQSYGMDMDVIRALGSNHIPETEQLYAGGSIAFMKMAFSAGALYSRPLISAESFVWIMRDYAVSPRQIKAAADMLFSSGVNQIIYHGIPYAVSGEGYDEQFGDIPWHPFSGPDNFSHFTDNYGPWSMTWDAMPELNPYLARSQKLLRAGRPEVDVFIYYPWIGFPSYFENTPGLTDTFLYRGYLPDAGDKTHKESIYKLSDVPFLKMPEAASDPRIAWLGQVAELTSELDRRGVTWAWTNAHALQTRGRFAAGEADVDIDRLVVFETETIELDTVDALKTLSEQGAELFFLGARPIQQKGFFDTAARDATIAREIDALAGRFGSPSVKALADRIENPVALTQSGSIKRMRRVLENGDTIDFFANLSIEPANAKVMLDIPESKKAYWFDAMTGDVWPAEAKDDGALEAQFTALQSRFLIVAGEEIPVGQPPLSVQVAGGDARRVALTAWTLNAAGQTRDIGDAFPDLRDDEALKHAGAPLVYSARFTAPTLAADEKLVLDLGRVEGVAEARVNGETVAVKSLHPFLVELTDGVQAGENELVISVRPPMRNELVGRALDGDAYAKHMADFEEELVRVGIVGPVSLNAYSLQ